MVQEDGKRIERGNMRKKTAEVVVLHESGGPSKIQSEQKHASALTLPTTATEIIRNLPEHA